MVARREYIAEPQVKRRDLTGEARPAPGQYPGAEGRAGVEVSQDEEEEIVGKGAQPVLAVDRPRPPALESIRRAPGHE